MLYIMKKNRSSKLTYTATAGSHGTITELDVNDTFNLSYNRLGSFVELIGAFSIDGTADGCGYIIGRIGMEFVSPPSWTILTSIGIWFWS